MKPWQEPYFADGSSLESRSEGIYADTVMRMKEKDRRAEMSRLTELETALAELVDAIDTARQSYGHLDSLASDAPAQYLLDALEKARSLLPGVDDE